MKIRQELYRLMDSLDNREYAHILVLFKALLVRSNEDLYECNESADKIQGIWQDAIKMFMVKYPELQEIDQEIIVSYLQDEVE